MRKTSRDSPDSLGFVDPWTQLLEQQVEDWRRVTRHGLEMWCQASCGEDDTISLAVFFGLGVGWWGAVGDGRNGGKRMNCLDGEEFGGVMSWSAIYK